MKNNKITMKEIAELCNVTKTTISRYFNGGYVKKETRDKISKVIKKYNYEPNTFARLKAKQSYMIGIITPAIDSIVASRVLTGLEKVKNGEIILRNANCKDYINKLQTEYKENWYTKVKHNINTFMTYIGYRLSGLFNYIGFEIQNCWQYLKNSVVNLFKKENKIEVAWNQWTKLPKFNEVKNQPLIGDIHLEQLTIRQRNIRGISHIPEDRHKHGLVLDFNLRDNLVLNKYFEKKFQFAGFIKNKDRESYARELIEKYDIRSGKHEKSIVRSMSGGNQQKAIIARELDKNAPLLIAVQPTRGLDVGAIEAIHHHILDSRDKGNGVLLVSLELEEVMNLADRILVMYNGDIVGQFDPKKVTTNELGLYMSGAKRQDVNAILKEGEKVDE